MPSMQHARRRPSLCSHVLNSQGPKAASVSMLFQFHTAFGRSRLGISWRYSVAVDKLHFNQQSGDAVLRGLHNGGAVSRRSVGSAFQGSPALLVGAYISSPPLNSRYVPVTPIGLIQDRRMCSFSRRPLPPSNSRSSRLAQGAGILGAASIFFGKTKYVLAALKVTKLASLGSMLATIGTYSIFFGWPYATGMVGLVLIHEAGHALVMIHRKIPFSPMVFIPFMGAVIAMRKRPRDAWEDALVAFGGPALGSLGAAGVAVAAQATDAQLLYALADFGCMINLFNLLPIGSMDGGRIAGALSPYAGVAGLGMGGLLAYSLPIMNPLFYLIMLTGGYETFQRFYNPLHMPPNYYRITGTQRVLLTAGYFGLIGALIMTMGYNARNRKSPEVLMRERDEEKFWKDAHM